MNKYLNFRRNWVKEYIFFDVCKGLQICEIKLIEKISVTDSNVKGLPEM